MGDKKPKLEMNVFYHPLDPYKEEIQNLLDKVVQGGIAKIRSMLPHDDCYTIYAHYPAKFVPGSTSQSHYGPTAVKYFLNALLEKYG